MKKKIYRLTGLETAISLLRPGAQWEASHRGFTKWVDSRPQPSWEEVTELVEKLRSLEDSIETIWLPEQEKKIAGVYDLVNASVYGK